MNKLRKESLEVYEFLSKLYPKEEIEEEEIPEILDNYPVVYTGEACPHRHWDEYPTVFQIEDKFVMAMLAKTTGDLSASEKGWEFDLNSLAFVYPKQKTITVYCTKEALENEIH